MKTLPDNCVSKILLFTAFGADVTTLVQRSAEASPLPENQLLDLGLIQVPNVHTVMDTTVVFSDEVDGSGDPQFATLTLTYAQEVQP